jgi:hypothetical protein
MPLHADGYLIPFTPTEITNMVIKSCDVRTGNHPTETRRVDENTMVRTFFVKWTERYNFVELVLGNSVVWTDVTGTPTVKLSRLLPDPTYGRHPTFPQIIATRIEYLKGHGASTEDIAKFPSYTVRPTDCCEAQVFYEHAPWAIQSDAGVSTEKDRYTSRSPTSTSDAEAFTLPGAVFKYVVSGGGAPHSTPVPFNVSFVRPVQRFTMTWHMIPNELYSVNGALFERLYRGISGDGIGWIGTVSKEDLVLPGLGTYPAGSLLLEGVEERRIISPLAASGLNGGLRWDIGFKLAFTPRLWTDLFYFDPATPANSGYYRVTNNGTYYAVNAIPDKVGLYNLRDFNLLWKASL